MRSLIVTLISTIALAGFVSSALPGHAQNAEAGHAQNNDFNLNVHANSHATAKDIGLPVYPGATLYKEENSDSSSADIGLVLNSFHFNVQAMNLITTDTPKQVLEFYRKQMAKYGQVLECRGGKPAGALTVTTSGLTCGDHNGGESTPNGSDKDIELRAGTPTQFRIVDIDRANQGKTKFGLVALTLPKDGNGK